MNREPARSTVATGVIAHDAGGRDAREDVVAAEEPLEVRVLVPEAGGLRRHAIAVTMRTPGHDDELAAGFLFSEGILPEPQALAGVAPCPSAVGAAAGNVVNVTLAPGTPFDAAKMSRNVYTTSSCGICGKGSLELVRAACPRRPVGGFCLPAAFFHALGARVRASQAVFDRTGGLHASALFDTAGNLLLVREDVGRHNALDKVVGALLLAGKLPADDTVLWVSGRASYELVQKAVLAGIPALAAVGAPSSLAVDMAREFGMTLIGFLRENRFNVYAGGERIA